MFLMATARPGVGFYSGRFWRFDDRAETATRDEHFRQLFLPYGVSAEIDQKTSVSQYNDRLYVVGGYTDNLVIDEHERVSRLGLMAPSQAPSIAGGGTNAIGYLSFWDELTDEHSPLSGGTAIGSTVTRTWSSLPTYEPNNYMDTQGQVELTSDVPPLVEVDTLSHLHYMRPGDKLYNSSGESIAHLEYPAAVAGSFFYHTATTFTAAGTYTLARGKPTQRASHVCLWLSVAGGLPRLVTKVRLGTTSVVESVAVASLGEAHPGNFERFPVCSMSTVYHDRLVMAGNSQALDTIYLSAIGLPERYEGFQFKTRNGEAVTGLIGTQDYCLILTESTTYQLQGFTEDDMVCTLQDNGNGGAGPFTSAVVHGTPYVANRSGVFMFNGTWHPVIIGGMRTFASHFAANRGSYENAYMVNNPIDKTIQLFLDGYSVVTYTKSGNDVADVYLNENYSWVVGYEGVQPQAGGSFSSGNLSTDRFWITRAGPPTPDYGYLTSLVTHSAYLAPEGGRAAYLYHVTDNGEILRETPDVAFVGESIVLTPTYLFDHAGGYETEGKTLTKFWTHASAEDTGFHACALGGDEWVGFQSFLTSTSAYGIDNPALLGHRLWGVVTGRLWPNDQTTTQPSEIVLVNGFDTEKYAHYSGPAFSSGSEIPPWKDPDVDPAESWVGTPKTVHEHPLPDTVSGRGLAFLYFFVNPKNIVWRGVGGCYVPGPATRPYFYVTVYEV